MSEIICIAKMFLIKCSIAKIECLRFVSDETKHRKFVEKSEPLMLLLSPVSKIYLGGILTRIEFRHKAAKVLMNHRAFVNVHGGFQCNYL